jgi:hypothetical protein
MAAAPKSLPVRHPRWKLKYTGKDWSADISRMVVEITYTEGKAHHTHDHQTIGAESDEIEVTLEDRDRRWQGPWIPQRGDFVELWMGYDGEKMLDCGDFEVDELELKTDASSGDTFHMKCIAAGIKPSLRTHRSDRYENATLIQVAQKIASRHGMTVLNAPANINVMWQRLSQRHETDLNFLRNLALAHGYDFTIHGSQLTFYAKAALEQAATVLQIIRTQCKSAEFKTGTQKIYKSATVSYQNPATKQLITKTATDSSSPTGDDLNIIHRVETPQQAQLKADSALHDANMWQTTGTINLEGTVLLVAGINIDISGFKAFDGKYHIESSKHRLERSSGYTTEVEIRKL